MLTARDPKREEIETLRDKEKERRKSETGQHAPYYSARYTFLHS